MTHIGTRYIDGKPVEYTSYTVAETAVFVRQALKEAFPGVKFSVRSQSYSGGASIHYRWTDGPTQEQAEAVAKRFQGAYFDGMIDYKGSNFHELDGRPVHYGADFISGQRRHSRALIDEAIMIAMTTIPELAGEPWPDVRGDDEYGWYAQMEREVRVEGHYGWAINAIAGIAHGISKAEPLASMTAARSVFTHDDGYGFGGSGYPDLERTR